MIAFLVTRPLGVTNGLLLYTWPLGHDELAETLFVHLSSREEGLPHYLTLVHLSSYEEGLNLYKGPYGGFVPCPCFYGVCSIVSFKESVETLFVHLSSREEGFLSLLFLMCTKR